MPVTSLLDSDPMHLKAKTLIVNSMLNFLVFPSFAVLLSEYHNLDLVDHSYFCQNLLDLLLGPDALTQLIGESPF